MRAIILARVSSKEQQEGYSIQTQTEQLSQYCQIKNFQIIETFQIVESSTRGDRKEFKAMLEFANKQSETIALITSNIDRLQRSFREYSLIDALIQGEKIEIHFVNENRIINKDSSSSDKMMWSIGIAVAQNYTDVLSEKVKGALHTKRENGEWTSKAPIGYKNHRDEITDKSTIILDKERAFLVKRIFIEYSTGSYSLSEMAKISRDWGLRNNYKNENPLSTSQLHRLIQNPFYYGEMRVMDKLYRHIYQPIIDKLTWDKCQEIRTGRSRTKTPRQSNKPFTFRGLIKCAISGRMVTSDIKKGKYIYLICRNPAEPSKNMFIKEEIVLDQIKDVFRSIRIEQTILENITEELKKSHESEKNFQHSAIIELEKENKKLQSKLDKLLDLFLEESITTDDYDKKCQELKNKQLKNTEIIKNYLKADQNFKITVNTVLSIASKAYELFESSNIEQKRKLINFMFSNLELEGATLRYSLKNPFDLMVDCTTHNDWLRRRDSNPRPSD